MRREYRFPVEKRGELKRFCERALEYDRGPELWEARINQGLRMSGHYALWVWDGGFLVAEVESHELGHRMVVVQALLRGSVALAAIERTLDEWAHARGAMEIVFTTRRPAEAFARCLGNDWVVDAAVLRRRVKA